MRSIKPGRGPSMMGGIMCIFVGVFGVIWTVLAASMGGGVFALFGVVFIAIAVIQAIYNFKNATSENRYSTFDITEDGEEPDPFNQRYGSSSDSFPVQNSSASKGKFCPYCGAKAEDNYRFCNECGRKLP